MKNTNKRTIRLFTAIAPMIGSRDVVSALRESIRQMAASTVDLDFADIAFISRSAAHEFLVLKDELKKRNIDLQFINAENEVAEMLRVVAANRTVPRAKDEPHFERVSLDALFA